MNILYLKDNDYDGQMNRTHETDSQEYTDYRGSKKYGYIRLNLKLRFAIITIIAYYSCYYTLCLLNNYMEQLFIYTMCALVYFNLLLNWRPKLD